MIGRGAIIAIFVSGLAGLGSLAFGQGDETLSCDLAYLTRNPKVQRAVPGVSAEAQLSAAALELQEANRDLEYRVTVQPQARSRKDRGFRIVLRNKRSDLSGHLDGTLGLLRQPSGASLSLQAPEGVNTFAEARYIKITCSLR